MIDRFSWNEQGWWAATIDIHTGEPKQPISKPSPINKNAAMVMAAGTTAHFLNEGIKIVDAALRHFPFGNRGDDGAHAVYSTALMHALLPPAALRSAQ